ncbi:hypothetical protein GCM10025876_25950 [Demequina litorisediminis]|uniref:Uncharacterized protein n=1 Tax=Demequina litorisediminis TaxID=1849022 RepID=A0ABQ6IGU0_9MICO|nr:hypothetical protein GCM10025876_25950 [Demequina litorisediminis]
MAPALLQQGQARRRTPPGTARTTRRLHITRSGNSVTVERDGGKKATATKDVALHWEGTSNYQSGSNEDPYVDIYNGNGASEIRGTHGKYRHGKPAHQRAVDHLAAHHHRQRTEGSTPSTYTVLPRCLPHGTPTPSRRRPSWRAATRCVR